MGDEYFGDAAKVALMRRAGNLWTLLRDDPRFAHYGRAVLLCEPGEDAEEILFALARVQGAGVSSYFPSSCAARLFAEAGRRGLITDRHEMCWGGEKAYRTSLELLARHGLPGDLRVSVIGPDSHSALVAEVAALSEACGVMPVPGSFMRGQAAPGLCLAACDEGGRVVGTASSYMMHPARGLHGTDAFWGMLATHDDRRGEKIALVLGATAVVHMWENHGARGFMTGVRADNKPSNALCQKLEVVPTDLIFAHCIDRDMLGTDNVTK